MYYLVEYFIALYVFGLNGDDLYRNNIQQLDYKYIASELRKLEGSWELCKRYLNGKLFKEWHKIFNDLFQFENRIKELEEIYPLFLLT